MQQPPIQQPTGQQASGTPDEAIAQPDCATADVGSAAVETAPRAAEQLLISATAFETRLAVMAEGQLQELHVTPTGDDSQVGTIALGKVVRVLPGMQAAFVELGLERPGFLHARDIERPLVSKDGSMIDARDIRKLVHEGQVLPVQVMKDPIASKGARLTTNLALPSRFLVLTPDSSHIGVSQRITDEIERDRLRDIVAECALEVGLPADHGFIVRTAAEGASLSEFMSDMQALLALWRQLERKRVAAKTGDALFRDLPNHIRALRDLVGPQTKVISIDDAAVHSVIVEYCKVSLPDYQHPINCVSDKKPLFERHGVEAQIRAALKPRVELPSGGYLIVEQTEAMVTIDVNTGGFTGSHSLEDTVFQTNLEAAKALPRQLRLRNLGGLVVVDFIDMESPEHQSVVMAELRKGCSGDAARVRLSRLSEFGLVELSRKRTRESLAQQLCEPCERCDGLGMTARPQLIAFEILRALGRHCAAQSAQPLEEFVVMAAQGVVNRLLGEDAEHLSHLVQRLGKPVHLQSEDCAPEHWELIQRPART